MKTHEQFVKDLLERNARLVKKSYCEAARHRELAQDMEDHVNSAVQVWKDFASELVNMTVQPDPEQQGADGMNVIAPGRGLSFSSLVNRIQGALNKS